MSNPCPRTRRWQTRPVCFDSTISSGAPVVDQVGRFVGILSSSDFVRHEKADRSLTPAALFASYELDAPLPGIVADYMTTAVQTIREDARLLDAGRVMTAQHVHRLPVVDQHNKLAGILTSLDLVAALVKVVDEWRSALSR